MRVLVTGAGGSIGTAATVMPAQLKDARHIEEAMEAAREIMRKRRNVLRELAK